MSQVSAPGAAFATATPQGPSVAAMLPELAAKAAWRWRWQLAPAAAATGVLTCGQTIPASLTLALGSASTWWAYRAGWTARVGGVERMLLSARERRIAATWLGAASAWALTASTVHLEPRAALTTLTAAVGWQSWQWAASRMPKRARLSPAARALVDSWQRVIAVGGPAPVVGSTIIRSTVVEPGPGAVTFEVALRGDVHGRDAAADSCRQQIERLLNLPVDTVQVMVIRDDSGRIRVTLSPNRHLEAAPVEWPGPILEESGLIPIAADPAGKRVAIALFNDEGVENAFITGTMGSGKSGTVAAVALPGVSYGIETLWLLDGGEGTSAPFLRPACDWYAMTREEWIAAIDCAYAVMLDRKYRRGRGAAELGLPEKSAWHTWDETDPILTLLIEEATTVAKKLPKGSHDKVVEILREGRKLGVRIIQVAQLPKFDQLIGGIDARSFMAGNGSVIAHRPGGSNDSRLTLDSTDVDIDLRALPPDPGFAAIVRKGKVLAPICRVANAKDRAGEEAAKVTVRALAERDELAAGANYLKRHDPASFIPAKTAATSTNDAEAEETPAEMEEADAVALRILRDTEDGLTLQELGGSEDGKAPPHPEWRWTRRTASKALTRLNSRELATKRGAKWVVLEQPAETEETR